MRKEKIFKNEVYVLNQPRKSILSIVLVDSVIDSFGHLSLDSLSGISDVIFVFSSLHFPHLTKETDKRKYTNLYGGCGFIESPDLGIGDLVFKSFEYSCEIFECHGSVIFTTVSGLNVPVDNIYEKVLKLAMSSVTKPVMKINRLSHQELLEIYMAPDNFEKDISLFRSSIDVLLLRDELEESISNHLIHCKYGTESEILYFKVSTLKSIIGSIEDFPEYIRTFDVLSGFHNLMASLVMKSGFSVLDIDLDSLDIGDIKGDINGTYDSARGE